MSSEGGDDSIPRESSPGAHELHLAVGGLAQQVSLVAGVVSALVSTTVLARSLSLSEFGTYAVLVSLGAYVVVIQSGIDPVATKLLAQAVDPTSTAKAFSTSALMYGIAGVLSGLLIAGVGWGLLHVLHIPSALGGEARAGVLAVAAVTAAGWPLRVFHVALRGSQRFVLSATAEVIASATIGATLVVLVVAGSPLWLLAAVGASPALVIGVSAATIVRLRRYAYHVDRQHVTRSSVRAFLGQSGYLSLAGLSSVVIYSLDRMVLAAFRPAATVALYEGPARAHDLIRNIHAALSTPVLPAAARYIAERDEERTKELLIRGMRYTLAVVIPLTLVVMILVGYWLLSAQTGVGSSMLVAVGRTRQVAIFSTTVAVANLSLSLALTPVLGLNGVVLGTAVPSLLALPVFGAMVLSAFPVRLRSLAVRVWLPAYSTAAVFAVGLLSLRVMVDLATLPVVAAAGILAVLGYWVVYYAVWLDRSERALVRSILEAIVRGRRRR